MKMIDREKGSKALSEVKPVKTKVRICRVLTPVQKKVLPSHELQDHAYE